MMLLSRSLTIILVHANTAIRTAIELLLLEHGRWRIYSVPNGGEALRTALIVLPLVVLLDPYLRGMDGIAIIAALRAHGITVPVVALVEGDDDSQSSWQQRGFAGAITLSNGMAQFRSQLQALLEPHSEAQSK